MQLEIGFGNSQVSRSVPRWIVAVAACSVLGSWCVDAVAEPVSERPAPGVRTHDGFYMRFASGFGVYDEFAWSESKEEYDGRVRVRARGFANASEFALGGTPYPGLVIGGGIYSIEVITSSVTTDADDDELGVNVTEHLEIESRDLTIIGVFADRYFVPTLGLHVQIALGVAQQIGLTIGGGEEVYNPYGPGLMLGVGYEMWLTEQWSVGVLARAAASVLFGTDVYAVDQTEHHVQWFHFAASWPSFLMTVTYH